MKKSLVLALVAVLVLSFASMAFAFTDTTSHWAKDYIAKLVDLKVVNGTTATTFVPDGKVTRAEFAKMIVNAKGLALENPATATFSDVATTAWYFPYVEAAAKAKYIDGVGDGKFAPMALVTREQVAKMVVLAAGKTADTTKALNFDDKASISDWAKGFVAVAADLKLIEGYNNKFNAKNNATRAEAAKLVYGEMKYEGKIVEDVVVPADMMTEVNTDTLVIGGKTYDLLSTAEFLVGTQLVNKDVLVENTRVKFFTNATGKINKVVVDAPDYNFVKGEVTATGDDGDAFVMVNDKKIYVDTDDTDYYSTTIDEDDIVAASANPGVMPTLNKDYLIVYDSKNFAKYAIKLATSATTGKLDSKGENKDGKFIVIDTKTYYFNENSSGNYDVDVLDASPAAKFTFSGADNDFDALNNGDRVEFETNSDNEITALKTSAVDLEGITGTPIYDGNDTVGYYVYIPLKVKANDNYPAAFNTYIVSDKRITDAALKDFIDDADVLQPGTAITGLTKKFLDTDAKAYLNGAKVNLYDIKRNSYVTADIDSDGKVTKVNVYNKKAFGLVESIEKSSDKVVSVTVNGTKFVYDGKSDKYESLTKGKVSVTAADSTGNVTIEKDYFVAAVLNADGNIISFNFVADSDNLDATVIGKEGEVSKRFKEEDGYKTINIPTDVAEVAVDVNGLTRYAWITFDDDASNESTTSMSIKAKADFAGLAKGEKAYIYGATFSNTNTFETTTLATTALTKYEGGIFKYSTDAGETWQNAVTTVTAGAIFQK